MRSLPTRKPTGRPPWPLILIEAREDAAKTHAALVLIAEDRVGRMLVFDLAEGSADRYAGVGGHDPETPIDAARTIGQTSWFEGRTALSIAEMRDLLATASVAVIR